MKKLFLGFLFTLASFGAFAQSVQQSGTVTVGQAVRWVSNGVIGGGGTAADGLITALGVTNANLSSFCISSARASAAGRNQLCFGAQTSGAAVISLQNYGSATAQDLIFRLNGTDLTLPSGGGTFLTGTGAFTVGHAICVNNTSGVLQDCGVTLTTGTAFGLSYYSSTSVLGSLAAATNGQMLVGTTSAAPNWRTLSGDVSAVSAAGAVTLQSVNGVTYPATYTANGVLYASTTTAVVNVGTANIGYCLLSQGSSSAPIWAACASGSGSAGGSNTQVQFNNSSSLGGSVNLTWVSPALVIGVAGTTTGQLQLAAVAGASGIVTVQNPSATVAYNFNLPTAAGSLGQPLLSGGGGSTAMSFGTLAVAGGGTNCAAASGTCLDNITGFSSTGYVNRTGAGTYAFSSQIPVSSGGTSLASGTSGGILGFTASGVIASSAALGANGVVIGSGAGATPTAITAGTNGQLLLGVTGAAPAFATMGTDATIASNGALTIANNAVTNAKMATAAANTFKGNATTSTANVADFTITSLTTKASPAAGDLVVIEDSAASGALKKATVASIASAGSVSSIAGNTGAFTLTLPITNATNAILLNAALTPQGRITLLTADPVMTPLNCAGASCSAKTTVFYTPYVGNLVPIYDGTNIIPTAFAEVSQATTDNTKSPAAVANSSNYDVFCWVDSGTNRCTRGPAWTSSTGRGTGAGTTELIRVNGLLFNANNITNGPNAQRGTYVGSIRSDGSAQINFIHGAAASGGTAALFGVCNYYNRVSVNAAVTDSGASYSYATATIRQARASAGNQVSYINCLPEDGVSASYMVEFVTSGVASARGYYGIGIDSTTTFAAQPAVCETTSAGNALRCANPAVAMLFPGLGLRTISANELGDGANNQVWDAASTNVLQVMLRL